MRIKQYSYEEIKENINNIVLLVINNQEDGYRIKPVEIIKITEKTIKTAGGRTVRFADIGNMTYNSSYLFDKDIEEAVKKYKEENLVKYKRQIEVAQNEIDKLNKLKKLD
jgi:hypothetical protein